MGGRSRAGRTRWPGRLLDLTVYAVGMTLVVTITLVPASLLTGTGLNGVKYGLFVVGVLAFGYATVLLWPSRPGEDAVGRRDGQQGAPVGARRSPDWDEPRGEAVSREETRFESLVGRVPPLEWYDVPPVERFHPGTKLYVASLLLLAVSYALEAVLGVRA